MVLVMVVRIRNGKIGGDIVLLVFYLFVSWRLDFGSGRVAFWNCYIIGIGLGLEL